MTILNFFPRSMIMKSVRAGQPADPDVRARSGIPRVVIAGETNSGKTSLVNVLLRTSFLPTDIVANTRRPALLRYGHSLRVHAHKPDGASSVIALADIPRLNWQDVEFIEIAAPNPVLRRMEILDLPGFVSRLDAEDKKRWLKPTDIVIWCSPATQSWKASEQAIWLGLDHPKQMSFLAVTHRDLLSTEQFGHVTERMSREAPRFFLNWSAIATTRALAAWHSGGQAAKREMRSSTGIDDFMRKLINLFQGAVSSRSGTDQTPEPPAPQSNTDAGNGSGAPHPLLAFAQLRHEAERELNGEPDIAAGLLAGKLNAYSEGVLRPWMLSKGRTASQSRQIESLINIREEELHKYFAIPAENAGSFTPSQVLQQLAGELGEILTSIEARRS